jgi:hypothetical protein
MGRWPAHKALARLPSLDLRLPDHPVPRFNDPMPELARPVKITFGEMRASGVHSVVVYCADYRCSHSTTISAEQWAGDLRLSDIESQFVCSACGKRGADVRPLFEPARMGTGG